MSRRKSQISAQIQQLIDSNLQLAFAIQAQAQSHLQMAAAIAQLVDVVADDVNVDEGAPQTTYLNGRPKL